MKNKYRITLLETEIDDSCEWEEELTNRQYKMVKSISKRSEEINDPILILKIRKIRKTK